MADMFLVLEGIKGESIDDKFKDHMEIMNWTWTLGNNANWKMTPAEAASKADVKTISIEKAYDTASAMIVKYCCLGLHIPSAQIICRKNTGHAEKLNYLVIKMQEVMVKNIIWSGSGFDKSPETITLSFGKFQVEYTLQPQEEARGGPKTKFGFDIGKQIEITA